MPFSRVKAKIRFIAIVILSNYFTTEFSRKVRLTRLYIRVIFLYYKMNSNQHIYIDQTDLSLWPLPEILIRLYPLIVRKILHPTWNRMLLTYSKPSLQRQLLFPKMLPSKCICCCKESVNAAEWYTCIRKGLFYSYFFTEHMIWIFVRIASQRLF